MTPHSRQEARYADSEIAKARQDNRRLRRPGQLTDPYSRDRISRSRSQSREEDLQPEGAAGVIRTICTRVVAPEDLRPQGEDDDIRADAPDGVRSADGVHTSVSEQERHTLPALLLHRLARRPRDIIPTRHRAYGRSIVGPSLTIRTSTSQRSRNGREIPVRSRSERSTGHVTSALTNA